MDPFSELLPQILDRYHRMYGLAEVPIKVDCLRQLIEGEGYADRIVIERFDFESQLVIAKIEFYRGQLGVYAGVGDYAVIQYSKALNFCWTRFAVLKEMYHCLLDQAPSNRVTGMAELMKLGQMLVSEAYASLENFPPFRTEEVAEILAMETLFPLELRSHHKEAYDLGQVSDYQLSLRYRIPERYVRLAMLKGYYELMYRHRANSLIKI